MVDIYLKIFANYQKHIIHKPNPMSNLDNYIIYQPTKTAMQSGKKNSQHWVICKENQKHRGINPLMGWTTSSDSETQVTIQFSSKEKAIAFAKRQNYQFTIIENHLGVANIKPKSYANNFL